MELIDPYTRKDYSDTSQIPENSIKMAHIRSGYNGWLI